ncbi:porin [Pseudoduganella ginsengisoli]|uniref:Porin n=1 Tax=Pseudoduganella ginsengisoli TaxID=1462440 RepID=A0A6L6PXL4_9BURK|nr:porin [Pseudoduganella ginsengisoli]MTW01688.1 porin [Pseudoduganella ginsengisoli]
MNRTLIAAASTFFTATLAHAQSNVAFYGSIDSGPTYVSNVRGHSVTLVDDGVLQADRFGLRGSEDLGGGTRAIFNLEGGFVASTGAQPRAGVLFNRQSYAGLAGGWGTLAIGHQTNMMFDAVGKLSNGVLFGSFYAFHPGNIDEFANVGQVDNAVKFTSASYGGLTAGAMLSLGEQPGDAAKNRAFGVNASYVRGPLKLGGAYTSANNKALNLGAALGIKTLLGQNLIGGSASAPVYTPLQADKVRNTGVGASYALDGVLLHAAIGHSKIQTAAGSVAMTTPEGGVNVQLTPADSLNFAVSSTRLADKRWRQFEINNVVSLSKRTEVYAMAVFQKASGAGAVAAINSLGLAAGQRQHAIRLGVHHLF